MNSKKIFTPYTFVLLLLLAVVAIYIVFFLPQKTAELNSLDSQYKQVTEQIDALAPYEGQEDALYEQAESLQKKYENDRSLLTPEVLSNRIFAAGTKGDIHVSSVSIADGGDVVLENGTSGHLYTANVTCDVTAGKSPKKFLDALETTSGAGMYVKSLSFAPAGRTPEQGDDPIAAAAIIAQAEKEAEQIQAQQEAEVSTLAEQYYELKKKADAALTDAQNKAAVAAATGTAEDAVAAQVAADLASSLQQQLMQFATDNGLATNPTTGNVNIGASIQSGSEVADTAETELAVNETGNFSIVVDFYTVKK